jgi:hypothetical protein
MSSELTRKCLDNCTLFAGCSKQMKDAIKGLLREVHFSSEEFLVQINTVAHDMFFIMSGKVEQLTTDSDGQQMVEYRIGRGGSVGVLAAYFGIRYLNSVRATSLGGPCLCLRLVRNHLMPVLKAYPEDEEIVAQNAMSDFQKVKIDKSVAGGSVRGRSVKSGARSVQSNNRLGSQRLNSKERVCARFLLCNVFARSEINVHACCNICMTTFISSLSLSLFSNRPSFKQTNDCFQTRTTPQTMKEVSSR